MSSTFFGISLASSGLEAQRRAMDIVGYNIAHANDPTYHRQRVVLTENAVLAQGQEASAVGASPFGDGVSAGDVQRVRDAIIESRMRTATQESANWSYRSQTLQQVESMLGEPSDTGLQNDLDQFWSAWNVVASAPESLPVRASLLENATGLAQRIQFERSQMSAVVDDLNAAVSDRIDQINSMGQELADLNGKIAAAGSGTIQVNDMENRRDALVQELSKLAGVTQHGDGQEGYIISLGGRVLVQGTKFNALQARFDTGGNRVVEWASDGGAVLNTSGELKAIADLKDTVMPGYIGQLDSIAALVIVNVNALHATGRTLTGAVGGEFFQGTGAGDIRVAATLAGHPDQIAASATGAVGDNTVANSIAQLQNTPMPDGITINQHYRNLVGEIGSAAAIADKQSASQKLTLDQFTAQQQSVSGVSLDEEMANMIKFQQAYNASARILRVFDDMLTTLINHSGA